MTGSWLDAFAKVGDGVGGLATAVALFYLVQTLKEQRRATEAQQEATREQARSTELQAQATKMQVEELELAREEMTRQSDAIERQAAARDREERARTGADVTARWIGTSYVVENAGSVECQVVEVRVEGRPTTGSKLRHVLTGGGLEIRGHEPKVFPQMTLTAGEMVSPIELGACLQVEGFIDFACACTDHIEVVVEIGGTGRRTFSTSLADWWNESYRAHQGGS